MHVDDVVHGELRLLAREPRSASGGEPPGHFAVSLSLSLVVGFRDRAEHGLVSIEQSAGVPVTARPSRHLASAL